MTVNQLVFAGDSLPAGYVGNFGYQSGGRGSFAQLVADRLAAIPGLGPLVSSGIHQANIYAQLDWTFTTGGDAWTDTASTDAWDKGLYGVVAFQSNAATLKYASGASKIATWTAGTDIRYPNVGFQVTWADYTSGGTWSYSTDGGSSWTNVPDTPTHGNTLRKLYVATPIAQGGTVKFRGANAAGTAQGCCIHNIEVFYQTPSTASGLIVHNAAIGGTELHDLTATTSGDRLAWFDSVTLGSGSPITNAPNLGTIVMHINDVIRASKTNWATDLTTFNTRISPLGPVGIISPWECITSFYAAGGGNGQSDYRTQAKTTTAGFSPAWKLIDIYDQLAAMGITGNTQTDAAGLLYDLTHESQALHLLLADWIYWWIRNQFLSTLIAGNSNPFTLGASALGSATQLGGRPSIFVNATAALSGGGTFAATGRRVVVGTASLAGGGTFSCSGTPQVRAVAAFAGGGTFHASGTPSVLASATLAGGGTFAATGRRTVLGTAALLGGGTFAAVGQDVQTGVADLELGGTLTASGTTTVLGVARFVGSTDLDYLTDEFDVPITDEFGDPIIATQAAFHAAGTVTHLATALFAGGGTFSAVSQAMESGTATLHCGGTFTAAGTRTVLGTAAFSGGGSFACAGTRTAHGNAALSAGGTFTAVGQDVVTATASLAGGGTFTAAGTRTVIGHASLLGGGTFAATGTKKVLGVGLFSGGGTFSCSASGVLSGIAAFVGGGTFHASGTVLVNASASFVGGGSFAATGLRKVNGSGSLLGGGTFTVVGQDVQTGTATLTGGGSFVAHGLVKVSAVLAANFGGTFTAVGHDQPPAGIGSGIGRQKVAWRSDQRVSVSNDQRVSYRGRR